MASGSERIRGDLRALLESPGADLTFSAASIWGVAIKNGFGRQDFCVDPQLLRRSLLEHGYSELPITGAHPARVDLLPAIHKDPFDRILVAQAQAEGIILLAADPLVARYPGPIRAV
ncbi:MAG: type II toxin-antitoxin system VapC family toxin [Bryobacterales bacterium]|nr:type II toxin-antitoxin system VapC family toxin [Bryobacterales bacterium]